MNVAIVGATGYGGIQAVNLLKNNKNYKISSVSYTHLTLPTTPYV